jgi:polyhydroxybutyrate depolymerase
LPLVVSLHGLSGNGLGQEVSTQMNDVADTAGFYVVYPNGRSRLLFLPGWWDYIDGTGSSDDIGFMDALIDKLVAELPIDTNRIFMTGVSNGGGMTVAYACARPDRIKAIAPIIGAVNNTNAPFCAGVDLPPMIDFHGTADDVVPYGGVGANLFWPGMPPVPAFLQGWVSSSGCSEVTVTNLPDVDPTDGTTVTVYELSSCVDGKRFIHYRVNGGDHTIPGGVGGNNQDFHSASVIWEFFNSIAPAGSMREAAPQLVADVWPQPASSTLNISLAGEGVQDIQVMDLNGRLLQSINCSAQNCALDVSDLAAGMYVYQVLENGELISRDRFVVAR